MGPHCSIWHHWSCSVNWLPWAVAGYLRFSISWLRSYLSNRIFSVKMGNSSSSSADVPCGIPQGSFLVSILYSLKYITKYQWSHLEIVGKDTVLGFFFMLLHRSCFKFCNFFFSCLAQKLLLLLQLVWMRHVFHQFLLCLGPVYWDASILLFLLGNSHNFPNLQRKKKICMWE